MIEMIEHDRMKAEQLSKLSAWSRSVTDSSCLVANNSKVRHFQANGKGCLDMADIRKWNEIDTNSDGVRGYGLEVSGNTT